MWPTIMFLEETVDLGNGDFGKAWGVTSPMSDGPYIELMTGVYTDNQPGLPGCSPMRRRAGAVFYALCGGGQCEECHQGSANFEIEGDSVTLVVYATRDAGLGLSLENNSGNILWSEVAALSRKLLCTDGKADRQTAGWTFLIIAEEDGRELMSATAMSKPAAGS